MERVRVYRKGIRYPLIERQTLYQYTFSPDSKNNFARSQHMVIGKPEDINYFRANPDKYVVEEFESVKAKAETVAEKVVDTVKEKFSRKEKKKTKSR